MVHSIRFHFLLQRSTGRTGAGSGDHQFIGWFSSRLFRTAVHVPTSQWRMAPALPFSQSEVSYGYHSMGSARCCGNAVVADSAPASARAEVVLVDDACP